MVQGIPPAQFLPQQASHRPELLNPQTRVNFQTTEVNRKATERRTALSPLQREATAMLLPLRGLSNNRTRVNLPTLLRTHTRVKVKVPHPLKWVRIAAIKRKRQTTTRHGLSAVLALPCL
jgi:hypothetical protein